MTSLGLARAERVDSTDSFVCLWVRIRCWSISEDGETREGMCANHDRRLLSSVTASTTRRVTIYCEGHGYEK